MAQWSACWAHNPKVPGSKPGSATNCLAAAALKSVPGSTSASTSATSPTTKTLATFDANLGACTDTAHTGDWLCPTSASSLASTARRRAQSTSSITSSRSSPKSSSTSAATLTSTLNARAMPTSTPISSWTRCAVVDQLKMVMRCPQTSQNISGVAQWSAC